MKAIKLVLVCLICLGTITAAVMLVQWLSQ